ncbi:MAG: DJ-1/PfpI family protein [Bacteroidota bacterium]
MKIAFIIFDGITWLDLIGIYDPITRLKAYGYLPDLEWDLCAFSPTAKDSFGTEMQATNVKADLSAYDMIIVPGGFGTRELQHEEEFMNWFKTATKVPYKSSICTGSLLLGAAGFLQDKHATTHFNEYESLEAYAMKVHKNRIVRDGYTITAGAVASSIDLGLYLCELLVDEEAHERIRKAMDYPKVEIDSLSFNT